MKASLLLLAERRVLVLVFVSNRVAGACRPFFVDDCGQCVPRHPRLQLAFLLPAQVQYALDVERLAVAGLERALLLQNVGDEICDCLPEQIDPEEFRNTIKWLSDAARDLQDVLDGLTLDRSKVQEQHGAG